MALSIINPPPADTLPDALLDEAKEHLRVEGDASDALIKRQIAAVADWLAGPHGWLGRSLITQTLALTVPLPIADGFEGPVIARGGMTGIALPRPPAGEVQKLEMLDAQRQAVVIAAEGFTTYLGEDGLMRVAFLPDFRWPVIARGPAFVRVTYTAGYGDGVDDLPAGLRHGILMAVARLHEARGDPFSTSLQDDPQVARMFAPYKLWTRGA